MLHQSHAQRNHGPDIRVSQSLRPRKHAIRLKMDQRINHIPFIKY